MWDAAHLWVHGEILHHDEYVVHTDRQHEEGNDLDDDQGSGYPDEAPQSDGGEYRGQHDEDAAGRQADLQVHTEGAPAPIVAQAHGDVQEHDQVGDEDCGNVRVRLTVQFIFRRALKQSHNDYLNSIQGGLVK